MEFTKLFLGTFMSVQTSYNGELWGAGTKASSSTITKSRERTDMLFRRIQPFDRGDYGSLELRVC